MRRRVDRLTLLTEREREVLSLMAQGNRMTVLPIVFGSRRTQSKGTCTTS